MATNVSLSLYLADRIQVLAVVFLLVARKHVSDERALRALAEEIGGLVGRELAGVMAGE